MDARTSALVGDWDLYAGPMHTELHLDADETYVHALWGAVRKHWGTWSLENQSGVTFLVLRLVDAYPRSEAGLFGWQPVQWPSVEAWPVVRNNGAVVLLAGAWMTRKEAVASAAPPYIPPTDLAAALPPPAYPTSTPLPQPPNTAPHLAPTAAIPRVAVQDSLAQPKPPTVMAQWRKEQVGWDSFRNVAAATLDDNSSGQTSDKMWRDEIEHEKAAKQALMDNASDFIRANNEKILSMVRGSPTVVTTFHYRR